jgi:methyl-accepting chemotaxis protein
MQRLKRSLHAQVLLVLAFGFVPVVVALLVSAGSAWRGPTTEGSPDALTWAVAVAAVAVLASGLAAYLIVLRRVVAPAAAIARDLSRLAGGDFSRPVEYAASDDLGRLADAARAVHGKLGGVIRELTESAGAISGAAEDLSGYVTRASQAVSHQQRETEQVATAMNEMSATIEEIARGAAEAARTTGQAREQADNGASLVNQGLAASEALAREVENAANVVLRLAADSESIGSVLDVIRGIAEQTNLLALNAAIEAARAGEQGRGFAVVADEVRTLAQRTQQSTQEIQGSIARLQAGAAEAVKAMREGQARVTTGVQHSRSASESLGAIAAAVTTIADLNARIATGAEEQTVVTNEVNRNVVNISDAGRQAADTVQRAEVASQQLAMLASGLRAVAGRFRL